MCRAKRACSWKESFEQGTVPVLRAQWQGRTPRNALPEGSLCDAKFRFRVSGQPGSISIIADSYESVDRLCRRRSQTRLRGLARNRSQLSRPYSGGRSFAAPANLEVGGRFPRSQKGHRQAGSSGRGSSSGSLDRKARRLIGKLGKSSTSTCSTMTRLESPTAAGSDKETRHNLDS